MKTKISRFFHSKKLTRIACVLCAMLPVLLLGLFALPKNQNKITASAAEGVSASRVVEFPIYVSFSASAYFSRFFVDCTIDGSFKDVYLTTSGLNSISVCYYTPSSGSPYWCFGYKSGSTYTLNSVSEASRLGYCCSPAIGFPVVAPAYVDLQVFDSEFATSSFGSLLTKSVFASSATLSSPSVFKVASSGYYYWLCEPYSSQSLDSSTFDSLLSAHPSGTTIYLRVSPLVLVYDSGGYVFGGASGTYDEGYQVGYSEGYNKGQTEQLVNPLSYFIAPVQTFLDTKLFGVVSIGTVLNVALFVSIALIFIKMFAGG